MKTRITLLLLTSLLLTSNALQAQNLANKIESSRIQHLKWNQGKSHPYNLSLSDGIEYNWSTNRWNYIGNQTWRSFSTVLLGDGSFNFLGSQTWRASGGTQIPNIDTKDLLKKYLLFKIDMNGNVSAGKSIKLGLSNGSAALNSLESDGNLLFLNRYSEHTTGSVLNSKVLITKDKWSPKKFASDAILSVDGKIYCEGMNVELSESWADYVFSNDYALKSLEDVENFISLNHHLPGVPSANEIETKGLNVAHMQKLQMEKIEELTLYMIQLQKENNKLKATIEQIATKIK